MTCWDKGIGHSRYRRQSHGRTCTHGGPAKANGLFGQMARKTADTRRQHAHKYHMHLPLPPESEAGQFLRKRIGHPQQNDRLRDSSFGGTVRPTRPSLSALQGYHFVLLAWRRAACMRRTTRLARCTRAAVLSPPCAHTSRHAVARRCAHTRSGRAMNAGECGFLEIQLMLMRQNCRSSS